MASVAKADELLIVMSLSYLLSNIFAAQPQLAYLDFGEAAPMEPRTGNI